MDGYKIVIDAGHGGADNGCSRAGIVEKDINLSISKKVQSKLENMGYQVLMIRMDDTYISKEERVKMANESKGDIYVSIHQNASEDISVNGMEIWYEGNDLKREVESERLSMLIQKQTLEKTQAKERELRSDAGYHVTGSTNMPACLVETGFLSNKAEREQLMTEEYQDQIADGIVQGIDYYFNPKIMYLTFDDGPVKENTERVLDVLANKNIKATFFLVGENVRKNPELAKRIVEEGHSIGVHCDVHDYDILYSSVDNYVEDFLRAQKTIYDVTGVWTNIFRFPGGSVNSYNKMIRRDIIEEMSKRGYTYFDWNASVEDAKRNISVEKIIENGVSTTLERKRVVMLAHDVVYNTGLCLEELIDQLPQYRMLPITEEVKPVKF